MVMLSLLRNYSGYASASALRLRPVLQPLSYVATRHFLTTRPNHSPTQKAGKEASSNTSTTGESDDKLTVDKSEKKPAESKKQDKLPAKRRILKKDTMPPFKRPMPSFTNFALEYRKKQQEDPNRQTSLAFGDILREAAAAWATVPEAKKQTYGSPPEALQAYKTDIRQWRDSLDADAKKVLKIRLRRANGTGYALFVSETLSESVGDTFGEKIKHRAAIWKALSSEEREGYIKRAAETTFGVRARRASQRERQIEREAQLKEKAKERQVQQKERAKKKAEDTKRRKAAALKEEKEKKEKAKAKKAESLKRKLEAKKAEALKRKQEAQKKTTSSKRKQEEQKKAQVSKQKLQSKNKLEQMKHKAKSGKQIH